MLFIYCTLHGICGIIIIEIEVTQEVNKMTIHVQDLANGKDIMVCNSYKEFDEKLQPCWRIIEEERIGSQRWIYVRKHTEATLKALYVDPKEVL